jgi:hypothetical protein
MAFDGLLFLWPFHHFCLDLMPDADQKFGSGRFQPRADPTPGCLAVKTQNKIQYYKMFHSLSQPLKLK